MIYCHELFLTEMAQILFYEKGKPYYEFSNFFEAPFVLDNLRWRTTEQYFQAQKFYIPDSPRHMEYYSIIQSADSPMKVFMLGRQKRKGGYCAKWVVNKDSDSRTVNDMVSKYEDLQIREDWETHKLVAMKAGLMAKFTQNIRLKTLLIETGDRPIIEDSPRDPYWGRPGNHLGHMLMEVRTELSGI